MTSTSSRTHKAESGVTLVEVMLAASILVMTVLAVFEGIAVSARIARENAEYLQADAYAFDLAWKRYSESYAALRNFVSASSPTRTFSEEITRDAAPMLYRAATDSRAVSHTTITRIVDSSNFPTELGLLISVDVEWGAEGARRHLSATHTATVFKSGMEDG